MVHTYNPSTWEAQAGGSFDFKARMVYIAAPYFKQTTTNKRNKTGLLFCFGERSHYGAIAGLELIM